MIGPEQSERVRIERTKLSLAIGKMVITRSSDEDCRDTHEAINALIAAVREECAADTARLRLALQEIANADYRGNRSSESQIAYRALGGIP